MMDHYYVSSYCEHGTDVNGTDLHILCSSPTGTDINGKKFARKPAQCKICGNPCMCPCHGHVANGERI